MDSSAPLVPDLRADGRGRESCARTCGLPPSLWRHRSSRLRVPTAVVSQGKMRTSFIYWRQKWELPGSEAHPTASGDLSASDSWHPGGAGFGLWSLHWDPSSQSQGEHRGAHPAMPHLFGEVVKMVRSGRPPEQAETGSRCFKCQLQTLHLQQVRPPGTPSRNCWVG